MRKSIFYILTLFVLSSCMGKTNDKNLYFDFKKVSKIELTNVDESKVYLIDEPSEIKRFFSRYVNNSERYLVKMMPTYKVTFEYQGKNVLLIFNGSYLKYEGVTYQIEESIDSFLKGE